MKKLQFIQSSGCRICSVQYLKAEAVLPLEEEQVCFSACWKVINNSVKRQGCSRQLVSPSKGTY